MPADGLDPKRTCLLFFDTSKIFVNGPSLKPEDRRPEEVAAVKNWERLLARARELDMMVAYAHTAQRGDAANYYPRLLDVNEQMQPYPPGERRPMSKAIFGTEAVEVVDEIAPGPNDYMFWKERWNPFYGTNLQLSLQRRDIDTLILCGGATEIGIAATVYACHTLDFDFVVVSDGCTSHYPDCQELFMSSLYPRIGRVRTTDQVLEMLTAGG
jgi:nicotinamidase-related amidase